MDGGTYLASRRYAYGLRPSRLGRGGHSTQIHGEQSALNRNELLKMAVGVLAGCLTSPCMLVDELQANRLHNKWPEPVKSRSWNHMMMLHIMGRALCV